jgi:hypothetical protein
MHPYTSISYRYCRVFFKMDTKTIKRILITKIITMVRTQDRIDEIFMHVGGALGAVDFKSILAHFWIALNNSTSVVDLAGIFTVGVSGHGQGVETLNATLFTEFFKAFARAKYPTGTDFCEKLLDELKEAKGLKVATDSPILSGLVEKTVVRVLLKYDLALRKAYSNFCGQQVRIGGILNWDEVKKMSIDMEVVSEST